MSKIISFARLQVGKPYVFGRSGPDSFDCSGLTKRAVAQIGLDWYHGATKQWNRGTETGTPERYGYFDQTGPIETLPTDRVAFLFNQDKTAAKLTMAHTGLYDGAGRVIQAGGYGGKGVHDNPIDRRRWSHWAILKEGGEHKVVYGVGSSGDMVKKIQRLLMLNGFSLSRFGADGKFGAETELAVKGFQRNNNLEPTGTVDEELLEMLEIKPPVGEGVTLSRELATALYEALKLQI